MWESENVGEKERVREQRSKEDDGQGNTIEVGMAGVLQRWTWNVCFGPEPDHDAHTPPPFTSHGNKSASEQHVPFPVVVTFDGQVQTMAPSPWIDEEEQSKRLLYAASAGCRKCRGGGRSPDDGSLASIEVKGCGD